MTEPSVALDEPLQEGERRILVLAPTGRDAQLVSRSLIQQGHSTRVCRHIHELGQLLLEGAGAGVIAEESLTPPGLEYLSCVLGKQPTWSDFPLILLCTEGEGRAEASWETLSVVEAIANVTLLERPLREITLLSAVEVALRSRAKQYQVRDQIKQRMSTQDALVRSENMLRRQAEELELRVAQRTSELLAANQELEGFTYSIAHDLRGPLRRLMLNSQIVQEDYDRVLDSEGKTVLSELANEARKLTRVVEDLLQYARLAQQPVKRSWVNVSKLAVGIAEGMGEIRASLHIESNLIVRADQTLIELVLRNLFDNASKYRHPDRPLQIWIGKDRDKHALYVRDNGIGFDMAFAEKIFKPFERLHRDSEYPGSGIGLANVKRIIGRHGGAVWAEGEENQGATFYFSLASPSGEN